jgi:hypothetical protein
MPAQSDLHYGFAPGGGLADPSKPGKRIGDVAVLGVRGAINV